MIKDIVYYTDSLLDHELVGKVKNQILKANLPIISVSLNPLDFGENIVYKGEPGNKRGWLCMFNQMLYGLETSKADVVFLCEHDVLYHPSHFEFEPQRDDVYYYNNNTWKYKLETGQLVGYDSRWQSQLCGDRKFLVGHYKRRLAKINKIKLNRLRTSPGTNKDIDTYKTARWESKYPNIDIKHGKNLTGTSRFCQSDFRNLRSCRNWRETTVDNVPGWDLRRMVSL